MKNLGALSFAIFLTLIFGIAGFSQAARPPAASSETKTMTDEVQVTPSFDVSKNQTNLEFKKISQAKTVEMRFENTIFRLTPGNIKRFAERVRMSQVN